MPSCSKLAYLVVRGAILATIQISLSWPSGLTTRMDHRNGPPGLTVRVQKAHQYQSYLLQIFANLRSSLSFGLSLSGIPNYTEARYIQVQKIYVSFYSDLLKGFKNIFFIWKALNFDDFKFFVPYFCLNGKRSVLKNKTCMVELA